MDRPRRSDVISGQMDGEAAGGPQRGMIEFHPLARIKGVCRQQHINLSKGGDSDGLKMETYDFLMIMWTNVCF